MDIDILAVMTTYIADRRERFCYEENDEDGEGENILTVYFDRDAFKEVLGEALVYCAALSKSGSGT